MFNATGQSGVLFGNTKSLNLFGQNQSQVTGFFGSPNTNLVNGTTIKYVPLNGTDTIQKNNQTVSVSTKLNCISAMKEYEMKSLEELRLEDYTANRISPKSNTAIFSSNQPTLFNNQTSLFQNSSPFGSSTQQPGLGTVTTQSSFFGSSNNQTNAFGTKNLFGNTPTPTSTNSAFGTFNNQSKPGALFGVSSTQNKPLFGAATQQQQPIQSTSLFGSQQQQQTSSSSLFGNQTQTGLFGGLQSQQQQPNQLFNTNTSTSSFGFQSQPSTGGLFGSNNTASKPFGTANTSFSFASTNQTQTNPSLFGNSTAQTGGLFSQNTNSPVFGSTSKPSLFSNTNTFTTPASSQSQSLFPQTNQTVTGFGQTNTNIFGNQPKPNNQTPFGTVNAFNNNNTQKPSLFGNTVTNTGFGGQSNSLFGNFGNNTQPFGSSSTITTSTMMPINSNVNGPQMGATTLAEAAFQQQLAQQKVLSLVANRPYGINKLFMGQNLLTNLDTKSSGIDANNTNVLSVAIKRTETENLPNRRRILNQKTKINPGQVNNVFSGFDEDEDLSIKSNKFDSFMVKRDDWKYLPPNAFEKSRKSLISNNSFNNTSNLTPDRLGNANSSSRLLTAGNPFNKESNNLLSDSSFRQIESINLFSPIHNGRTSPVSKNPFSNKKEGLINNSNNDTKEQQIKSKPVKEESLISSPSVIKPIDIESKLADDDNVKPAIINGNENENNDDGSDESINGDVESNCQIILTKEGYSTCPTIENLNQLVNGNECWVKNFEIQRKDYGSIKFPGYTNVYGLDLDNTVNILHKEVSVYPDDNTKPEQGDGLNKQAQITLMRIFPLDKSTGKTITDCDRLKTMNFEERIRKVTNKIGARFVSYKPTNGVWVFEVDHFSKYAYFDPDEEDNNGSGAEGEGEEEIVEVDRNTKKKKTPKVEFKKETLTKPTEKENILKSQLVVSSEADSMSQIEETNQKQRFRNRSALDRLSFNSKNTFQRNQSYYNYESDEDVTSSGLFHNDIKPINKFELKENEKYQPLFKKFETSEMGERIYNSRMDCSTMSLDISIANKLIDSEESSRRTIKPLASECVASTSLVNLNHTVLQRIYIPQHLRDVRLLKMPYLPDKFINYFDNITVDIHQKYSHNVALIQGNRFRVGFHVSRDKNSFGLKFFKINTCHENDTLSFRNMHRRNDINSIVIMKCRTNLSDYQEKLLESAFSVSSHSIDSESKCPFWSASSGLEILNSYLNVHNKMQTLRSNEKNIFGRIFNLCNALWNSLGVAQEKLPGAIQDMCRKQTLSKWIRMQCRGKLMTEVDTVMKSSVINSDKCNTLILDAICCGEINLACKLAILTNQHRLSLLIAQAASNLQIRDTLKEQLNQWLQTRVDVHMPPNLLCIYLLLSGQTSSILSDGSILAPFKHLNWVQSFGCHFWYIQSYLGSIKSAVEMYDESFKTELDIPLPFPIDSEQADNLTNDDDSKYYDVCYHLIKLYCDRLYDLDVLLNPPAISNEDSYKLSWNWSASWHLANILMSLGYAKNISPKISTEWAAQLEREGMWKMAAFVVLHVPDLKLRIHLVKSLICRQVKETKDLNDEERFLVENLHIPIEWIHEAKAIYCKALGNLELEAYHWLKSGQYEKSYQLYAENIIPTLLINDKFDKVKKILHQFIDNSDRVLVNWPIDGEIYLKYICIVTTLRTFKLTNKLVNYSCLVECGELENGIFPDKEEVNIEIQKLQLEIIDLSKSVNEFKVNNETQRICKQQFQSLCNRFKQINSTDEMF